MVTPKNDEITINGVKYIPANSVKSSSKAKSQKGLKYVICRTYSAGVFAGYLVKTWVEDGIRMAKLQKSRRLWYWKGAASLSQLAMEGVKNPTECKFPCEIDDHEVSQVIEILDATEKAKESIDSVKVWEM